MYFEITERYAGSKTGWIKELEKLDYMNFDLSKANELRKVMENLTKLIKKKDFENDAFDDAAKVINSCIEKTAKNFNEKYFESGFLPKLPENKELVFKGIVFKDHVNIFTCKGLIRDYIAFIVNGVTNNKITPDEYLRQIRRLLNINRKIFDEMKDEFFEYYPCTANGQVKKGNVKIADSGFVFFTNCDYYTQKQGLNLSIIYQMNWNTRKHEYYININENVSGDKTPPIFDENDVPAKPVRKKTIYIKQNELVTGNMYVEKEGGPEFIYIGSYSYVINHGVEKDDIQNVYLYIRNTKKIEKLAKEYKNFDEFYNMLVNEGITKVKNICGNDEERFKEHVESHNITKEQFASGCSLVKSLYNPKKFIDCTGTLKFNS